MKYFKKLKLKSFHQTNILKKKAKRRGYYRGGEKERKKKCHVV